MYRAPNPLLVRTATVFAIAMFASACGERAATRSRPQLLSVEAARFENVDALEKLGLEDLAHPSPARFIEFEASVAGSLSCLDSRQNADRID
jgi:hypothetical protein